MIVRLYVSWSNTSKLWKVMFACGPDSCVEWGGRDELGGSGAGAARSVDVGHLTQAVCMWNHRRVDSVVCNLNPSSDPPPCKTHLQISSIPLRSSFSIHRRASSRPLENSSSIRRRKPQLSPQYHPQHPLHSIHTTYRSLFVSFSDSMNPIRNTPILCWDRLMGVNCGDSLADVNVRVRDIGGPLVVFLTEN